MKIGDSGFAVLSASQMYRIEKVTILDEKEAINIKGRKIKYWEIHYDESFGVSGISKEKVFKTMEEAESYRKKLMEKEHAEFVSRAHDKENFFKYLYDIAIYESYNDYDNKYIANKIKEYTGINVLQDIENVQDLENTPYLIEVNVEVTRKYNPNYGDNKMCKCGHQYYRHFDSWEDMLAVGCKYCDCWEFVEDNNCKK